MLRRATRWYRDSQSVRFGRVMVVMTVVLFAPARPMLYRTAVAAVAAAVSKRTALRAAGGLGAVVGALAVGAVWAQLVGWVVFILQLLVLVPLYDQPSNSALIVELRGEVWPHFRKPMEWMRDLPYRAVVAFTVGERGPKLIGDYERLLRRLGFKVNRTKRRLIARK